MQTRVELASVLSSIEKLSDYASSVASRTKYSPCRLVCDAHHLQGQSTNTHAMLDVDTVRLFNCPGIEEKPPSSLDESRLIDTGICFPPYLNAMATEEDAGTDQESPATPSHHPTYNFNLSTEQLRRIAEIVWPDRELVHVDTLRFGKSYNNRIYFLSTKTRSDQQCGPGHEDFVLKLNGHYFDDLKVMNEVAVLLLLRDKAPDMPVPRVIAWSRDGLCVETTSGKEEHLTALVPETSSKSSMTKRPGGWIIMTRLPGRSLTDDEIVGESVRDMMKCIGEYVKQWRSAVQLDGLGMGNLRLHENGNRGDSQGVVVDRVDLSHRRVDITLNGPILPHEKLVAPLENVLNFYLFEAQDQLAHLKTSHLLLGTPQRDETIKLGEELIRRIMPLLQCWEQISPSRAVLSHLDLSPRNILVELVSGESGRLLLTGIVDWEFAGLMPEVEEWLNCEVSQKGDWPDDMWKVLVGQMREAGETVLGDLHDGGNEIRTMSALAPWFVQEGAMTAHELEVELQAAARVVREGVERLRDIMVPEI